MATTTATAKSGGSKEDEKKQLFFTTSDLVNRLNGHLESMEKPTDEGVNPRFELQKRLPDGSTRRASEEELAAADMQTKVKQAAEQVARLLPKEKIKWAKQQRQEGNKRYAAGNYKEAMDVYLTCLVAMPPQGTEGSLSSSSTQVFLPVLNNLAQTALKLDMWRKTEQFCTIAINEIELPPDTADEKIDEETRKLMSKIYFRRGKARRLRGLYSEARKDLDEALQMWGDDDDSPERTSVVREIEKVEKAAAEARKLEERQKQAMKQMLGGRNEDVQIKEMSHEIPISEAALLDTTVPVESDVPGANRGLYSDIRQRRAFSTLKAKPKKCDNHNEGGSGDNDDEYDEEPEIELSCWQHYLLVVATLAEKLLEVIGDEETVSELEKRRDEDANIQRQTSKYS